MPSTPKPKPSRPSEWQRYLAFSTEIVAILGLWRGLGYGIGKWLKGHPYGVLVGGILAVVHIFWRILKL
jgi:hypothetical protein